MIRKICHLSDIHIRKTPTRNEEYQLVFNNLIKSLYDEKPDRIVIAGDLVHDYLDLQGEQLILANKFLHDLCKIAPVRITRGNHDCRKKNLKRVDSVKAIVNTLNNSDIIYYDKTNIYYDDNIAWAVWHHGDKNNNPWKTKEGKIYSKLRDTSPEYIAIDLFHDPVNGCVSTTGFEMKSKMYYKYSDFKGDISMFGDIHKMQYIGNDTSKAYCGSLISQDISEGDDNFHGYLLWEIDENKLISVKEIPIYNDYSFKNVKITSYTDFDDLDFEISNPTTYMKVRFIWNTLPQTHNNENERKLYNYVNSKHQNVIFFHKNEFIENEKIEVDDSVTLENISTKTVQHEIFKIFLEKIGTDSTMINDIIVLDEEICNSIEYSDEFSGEWNILKFGGTNFMSYGDIDIDWRDMNGLFQIAGINAAGKTTIMKLISYVLFGKAIETESRLKFGDKRFVNNRNDATFCSAYIVIESNGEYYGIKKRTDILRSRDGEISGAPTTLNYYVLNSPDDEMNETNSLEILDEDKRNKTQKKINDIIGTYDNFMRVVMTTSDTLNRILSNDMAVFIDSILYDSGLDIFDKKLEGLKEYQKKVNEKSRININVELTTNENIKLNQEIVDLEVKICELETNKIPDIQNRIETGRTYVETLTKKLFKIDSEIYNLNINDVNDRIVIHKNNILDLKKRESVLIESIKPLKQSYDEEKLKLLIERKEAHKANEYNLKLKIKNFEQIKINEDHAIEIINGDIFRLKKDGAKLKNEILELKESKVCPTCGQELTPEHQKHIDDKIIIIETNMFGIANQIKTKDTVDRKKHQDIINAQNDEINKIGDEIKKLSLEMESVLKQIGVLTNDKNDVEKRKELQNELDQIPIKIQNEELKISILVEKINNYENSLLQIEENHKIEKGIAAAKLKVQALDVELNDEKENVFIMKTWIGEKSLKIKNNEILIIEFKAQEYRDAVMNLYKKCVHRDGIPRQMLSNYIIPKINVTLENILTVAPFKVWLDADDLRPKLAYNNRPNSIIDCISASGKERTFSSVVIKFALNQINVKAKPTIFLLDEVMGKLDEASVEEFIDILQLIKNNMKKVLVIEHTHEINPDYIINVQLNDDGISSIVLE